MVEIPGSNNIGLTRFKLIDKMHSSINLFRIKQDEVNKIKFYYKMNVLFSRLVLEC